MKIKNKEKAKRLITEFLNSIDIPVYPSDMSNELNIDYDLCVSIIKDLIKEDKLGVVGE